MGYKLFIFKEIDFQKSFKITMGFYRVVMC